MHVLVTGHLGYIGTILTPILVQAGREVVGIEPLLADRILDAELRHVKRRRCGGAGSTLTIGS
jgi:nucleoside-diphosphate-sugar epimerase